MLQNKEATNVQQATHTHTKQLTFPAIGTTIGIISWAVIAATASGSKSGQKKPQHV